MPIETTRAVGLFSDRQSAQTALTQLRDSGFDMNKISVVNKDTNTENLQSTGVNADKDSQVAESAKESATVGGITGGAIGLVGSLGVLAIPGVGPVAELGVLLANTVFAGALGAAGGGLIGALVGWGLSEEEAKYYSDRVNNNGNYLVIVEGDTATVNAAQTVLQQNRISDWRTFSSTQATATPTMRT